MEGCGRGDSCGGFGLRLGIAMGDVDSRLSLLIATGD
jgi:hypothetical protein